MYNKKHTYMAKKLNKIDNPPYPRPTPINMAGRQK